MPCRYGQTPIDAPDRAAGATRKVPSNESLTQEELLAVRAVLSQAGASNGGQCDFFVPMLEDGGYAEVFCRDIQVGCMVALRGITPHVLKFLFNLLQAGNWVMIPAMPDTRSIATSPAAFKRIPDGFPPALVCASPEEIGAIISGGFDAWKKYRDQFVGKSPT
jgi:hypothetical protein